MKFLKRIVYGVVVGTCLMMINTKCVKAQAYDLWGSWFTGPTVTNGYNYTLSNNTFYKDCFLQEESCVEQDDVGYIINPTVTNLGDNNYSYAGWDTIKSYTFGNSNFGYKTFSFLKGSINKYATFSGVVGYYSSQKQFYNYFIRVDRNKFDFTVNNYAYFCFEYNTEKCISFFSEGDLPEYHYTRSGNNYYDDFYIKSNTVIVYQDLRYNNVNDIYYAFRRGFNNEVYRISNSNRITQCLNTQNSQTCTYISTTDFKMYNYDGSLQGTLEGNAPPEDVFTVDWVKIDSTDDSDELYGNDNTVTSTNIGARFTPFDLTKYDYYLGFTTDSDCSDNLEDYTKMTSSDKGVLTIPNIKENGLVCAKITKVNTSNVIYTDTYEVDTVGKLSTFGFSNNKFSIFIDNLINKLNYGGPISSLLTIPLSLLSAIINAFNSSCSSYNLGQVLGHNIIFSCVTLNSILGSSITGVIDIFGSFTIYYHLVLFVISIYRKIMNLEDLDDYLPQHLYQPKHGSYDDLHS